MFESSSFFKKCLLFFCPIIHITKRCVTCDREKEIVPADDIYKRKVTSLLLMLQYLSAFFLFCFVLFFFTQCPNISQHHHYVIEKKKYIKIWPCSLQIIQCNFTSMVPKNEKKNKKQNMAHVQYTYIVAYVYHSVSFVLSACEGRCALAPQLLAIFVGSFLCT